MVNPYGFQHCLLLIYFLRFKLSFHFILLLFFPHPGIPVQAQLVQLTSCSKHPCPLGCSPAPAPMGALLGCRAASALKMFIFLGVFS